MLCYQVRKKLTVKNLLKNLLKKIANSFSGVEEKIGKNGSKKILDALDGLSAQGKSFIKKL